MADTQSQLNDWFLALPEERRVALLNGDRWMLAGAAFEAALASHTGEAEPVLWQERQRLAADRWSDWYESGSTYVIGKTAAFSLESGGIPFEFRPLYATPPAATPAAPGEVTDALKQWAWHWFGPEADEEWIAKALANLPPAALHPLFGVDQRGLEVAASFVQLHAPDSPLYDHLRSIAARIRPAALSSPAPVAAPAPASEAVAWSGWACQYPGKLPRLYGAKEIAEVNCDRGNGDCMLFLATHPQIKQEQPTCTNGTLNTSQQLLDAAWLGATQKPTDGSPERVGQDSHTQEGGSPELSDAVAAQRKWVDGHNERVTTHMSASGFVYPPLPVHHDPAAGQNLFTAEEMYEYAEDAFAHQAKFATPTPGDSADAPVQQAADRRGVYAWVTPTGHASLVLVSKRPTEHSRSGVLNASVIESVKFYDGCAVDEWGKDGRWVLLHDFDAALKGKQPVEPSGSERGEV
jgi:hypothetical protein